MLGALGLEFGVEVCLHLGHGKVVLGCLDLEFGVEFGGSFLKRFLFVEVFRITPREVLSLAFSCLS